MGNLIVGAIILVILSLSIGKVIIEKRRGAKCIGCPHGGSTTTKGCSCSDPVDFHID